MWAAAYPYSEPPSPQSRRIRAEIRAGVRDDEQEDRRRQYRALVWLRRRPAQPAGGSHREVATLELGLATPELGAGAREHHGSPAAHPHLIADAHRHPGGLPHEGAPPPALLDACHQR